MDTGQLRSIMGIKAERAKVMLLGTFHFGYPDLDVHKSEVRVDMRSEQRQAEIAEVVQRLHRFSPTKIALEFRLEHSERLNQRYQEFRAGTLAPRADEEYQLGFRLAALGGHDRVYQIDEWGRFYEPPQTILEYARKRLGEAGHGLSDEQLQMSLMDWRDADIFALARYDDQVLLTQTLRDHLRYLNSLEYAQVNHAGYLNWVDAPAGDYTIVDYITGWWFNRNLRIFANLKRITESAEDRILVIIGAAHVPILRHCVLSSPRHELVEVGDYL